MCLYYVCVCRWKAGDRNSETRRERKNSIKRRTERHSAVDGQRSSPINRMMLMAGWLIIVATYSIQVYMSAKKGISSSNSKGWIIKLRHVLETPVTQNNSYSPLSWSGGPPFPPLGHEWRERGARREPRGFGKDNLGTNPDGRRRRRRAAGEGMKFVPFPDPAESSLSGRDRNRTKRHFLRQKSDLWG